MTISTQTPSILIVDDQLSIIELVKSNLSQHPYRFFQTQQGKEVISIMETHRIDLILLDVTMPQMDGFEVCRTIKTNNKFSNTPVIFLTGDTSVQSLSKAFAAGGHDYITKPFSPTELEFRVKNHLELQFKNQLIEQKNKELNELNRLKDNFFHIVSHDLRVPFQQIFQFIEEIQEYNNSQLKDSIKEMLFSLLTCSEKGSNLLENLLDWTNFHRNKLNFTPVTIPLKDTMEELILKYLLIAEKKGIFIHNYINETITAFADPYLLQRILKNLITQAIQNAPPNGLIKIHANQINKYTLLSIEDSGPPIPKSLQNQILNQTEVIEDNGNSTSTLDLLICRTFAEKHNGELHMMSNHTDSNKLLIKLPNCQSL